MPDQMSIDQHSQRSRFLPHPFRSRDPHREVRENLSHQDRFSDLETVLAHLDAQDQELLRQTRLLRALVERLLPPDQSKDVLEASPDQAVPPIEDA
jgi:hypothetical protein